jgi:hypothetical protein
VPKSIDQCYLLLSFMDAKVMSLHCIKLIVMKLVQFRNSYKFSLSKVKCSKLLEGSRNTRISKLLKCKLFDKLYSEHK